MTHLLIFDLDGTLTDTSAVDAECYRATVRERYGADAVPADWSGCPEVTDAGILGWIHARERGAPLPDAELRAFRGAFVHRLCAARRAQPGRFQEVAGARVLLRRLARDGWAVSIATGGWDASAQLKLVAAHLPVGLLRATADDAVARVDVFRGAAKRARAQHDGDLETVTLIGDEVWDVETARALGWRFVGVGAGEPGRRLSQQGASQVVADYRDAARVGTALGRAEAPR